MGQSERINAVPGISRIVNRAGSVDSSNDSDAASSTASAARSLQCSAKSSRALSAR